MATITQCDRCGKQGDCEPVNVRNVRADICDECGETLFGGWLELVIARQAAVPLPTARNPFPRPPTHGYTAAAIEAASDAATMPDSTREV